MELGGLACIIQEPWMRQGQPDFLTLTWNCWNMPSTPPFRESRGTKAFIAHHCGGPYWYMIPSGPSLQEPI